MLRLFVGLPIAEETADTLLAYQYVWPAARWRNSAQFHITLAFLGDVSTKQARVVDEALAQIRQAPFDIHIKGAGHFGGDDPHAIYMGVLASDPLMALQAKVASKVKSAGVALEKRAYVPHVTMAYLRGAKLDDVMGFCQRHNLSQCAPMLADRFYLYQSHLRADGSAYDVVAEYPLLPPLR